VSAVITIVGLGPGQADLLTSEARETLEHANGRIFVRTKQHPVVAALSHLVWESFDPLYERAASFEEVYEGIVTTLIEAARHGPVVYAVPGHPLVGEATVRQLLARAHASAIPCRVIPGLSFVDVVLPLLECDALAENLQIVDAFDLAACLDGQPFSGGRWPVSPLRPALIGQVSDRFLASKVKLALMRLYPDDIEMTVISRAGMADPLIRRLPLYELDHHEIDALTAVFVPAQSAEQSCVAEGLQQIVARLRAPGGCPWDRQQTPQSLTRHVLEEAYELVEAIEQNDTEAICEELGDFVLQAFMQAQLAEEQDAFTLEDVFSGVIRKLVRRHPHVFGSVRAETAEVVLANWEQIKAAERAERTGTAENGTHDVSPFPALARAQRLFRQAARRKQAVPLPPQAAASLENLRHEAPIPEDIVVARLVALCALASEQGIDLERALFRWTRQVEHAQDTTAMNAEAIEEENGA